MYVERRQVVNSKCLVKYVTLCNHKPLPLLYHKFYMYFVNLVTSTPTLFSVLHLLLYLVSLFSLFYHLQFRNSTNLWYYLRNHKDTNMTPKLSEILSKKTILSFVRKCKKRY